MAGRWCNCRSIFGYLIWCLLLFAPRADAGDGHISDGVAVSMVKPATIAISAKKSLAMDRESRQIPPDQKPTHLLVHFSGVQYLAEKRAYVRLFLNLPEASMATPTTITSYLGSYFYSPQTSASPQGKWSVLVPLDHLFGHSIAPPLGAKTVSSGVVTAVVVPMGTAIGESKTKFMLEAAEALAQ